MKERRSSLTLGSLQQQQHATNSQQQQVSNPQHQLHNQQQQHFNLLQQQPNIVQQLSALQQQHQHSLPAGVVTSSIDYTPLKVGVMDIWYKTFF